MKKRRRRILDDAREYDDPGIAEALLLLYVTFDLLDFSLRHHDGRIMSVINEIMQMRFVDGNRYRATHSFSMLWKRTEFRALDMPR